MAGWYAQHLAGTVALPEIIPGHAWGLYTIKLEDAAARTRMQEALKAAGIPFGVYYPKPLHHQPAYAAAHAEAIGKAPPLPVSEALCHQVMSLPMHPYLDEADVARVAAAVRAAA